MTHIQTLSKNYIGSVIIISDSPHKQDCPTLKNQRTSGPVNAHRTPGPVIYFNAFIHLYSPKAGADNRLGTNVDANRKPLSLCPFVASFKWKKNDNKRCLSDTPAR